VAASAKVQTQCDLWDSPLPSTSTTPTSRSRKKKRRRPRFIGSLNDSMIQRARAGVALRERPLRIVRMQFHRVGGAAGRKGSRVSLSLSIARACNTINKIIEDFLGAGGREQSRCPARVSARSSFSTQTSRVFIPDIRIVATRIIALGRRLVSRTNESENERMTRAPNYDRSMNRESDYSRVGLAA